MPIKEILLKSPRRRSLLVWLHCGLVKSISARESRGGRSRLEQEGTSKAISKVCVW